MTREELLELIKEVQEHQTELGYVEAKTAKSEIPKRLYESLSAFANQPGGGVIILGMDENLAYRVTGVKDTAKLQEDISGITANQMEPPLRPEFLIEQVDGKTVLAVVVPELSPDSRPCYFKPAGMQKGSYVRVGNTNRQMTDYEVFSYVSARSQPDFDKGIAEDASLEDLDQDLVTEWINRLRLERPRSLLSSDSPEEVMLHENVICRDGGALRPTLAGLLVFGKYPQTFEPQLVITFLQYYGTTEEEKGPRGERFADNRKFEGTIAEIIDQATRQVYLSIRRSSLIEGLLRRDIPEYPEEAIREAIVNAVAHRDYSNYARGSQVQIRLFANRLEIRSPGGLFGDVTEDTIEERQSTRNRLLMRLMEDLHISENRGSGIRAMLAAMRDANLEPPLFQDKRTMFWVTFYNHTLMSQENIQWLNQYANVPLNDQQRLALVYARLNGHITNNVYRRLNYVDSLAANRALRGMVEFGLLEQRGTGRWTEYILAIPAEAAQVEREVTAEERILDYVRGHGHITRPECEVFLGLNKRRASYVLEKMVSRGLLTLEGKSRAARYVLP